jgi:hypothetical protein
MPIKSFTTYLSTTQEFITHWEAVNADLGAGGPLVLTGPYAVADLTASRTALQAKITAIEATDNAAQIAANDRDNKKEALRERVRQFRAAVQGFIPDSQYLQAMPLQPGAKYSPWDVMKALDDMARLWATINATPPTGFTPPLKLQCGYLIAEFNVEVTAMRAAYAAVESSGQNALIAREIRNQGMGPLRTRLVQYRLAVMANYTKGHAMIESLPKLYKR